MNQENELLSITINNDVIFRSPCCESMILLAISVVCLTYLTFENGSFPFAFGSQLNSGKMKFLYRYPLYVQQRKHQMLSDSTVVECVQ